ncbi:MAG: adenylate/guanylate cyclase domain-containing protein [Pseudomonadota bacterium]
MPQRRLSAILAADVVGYSRMMHADEVGTLARLKAYRNEVFNPVVAEHGGRVVKLMGDGMLVEFQSVVDAVNAAITIQEAAQAAPDETLQLRIGINLGDVIVDGDEIYGEGVNIASRLEALAEPSEVWVSAVVHESVRKRVGSQFVDAGLQALRNIEQPVHAFRWAGDQVSDAAPSRFSIPSRAVDGNSPPPSETDGSPRGIGGIASLGVAAAFATAIAVSVMVFSRSNETPELTVSEPAAEGATTTAAPEAPIGDVPKANQPATQTVDPDVAPRSETPPNGSDAGATPESEPAGTGAESVGAVVISPDTETTAANGETAESSSSVVASEPRTPEETEPLMDEALRRFLKGKTLSGGADFGGDRFAIKFADSGQFEGKVSFNDSFGSAGIDGGQWQVVGDQLCVAFNTLAQGRRLCASVVQDGDAFTFRAPDGGARAWSMAE